MDGYFTIEKPGRRSVNHLEHLSEHEHEHEQEHEVMGSRGEGGDLETEERRVNANEGLTYHLCGRRNLKGEPCKRIFPCNFHQPAEQRQHYVKRHWTREEHVLFLEGMELFGRGKWKFVSEHIKTKSQQQVKQHAKRYFRRMQQTTKTGKKHASIHDLRLPPLLEDEDELKTTNNNNNGNRGGGEKEKEKGNEKRKENAEEENLLRSEDRESNQPTGPSISIRQSTLLPISRVGMEEDIARFLQGMDHFCQQKPACEGEKTKEQNERRKT